MSVVLALFLAAVGATLVSSSDTEGHFPTFKDWLADRISILGHRNWIVVADAAYPLQTAVGIQNVSVQMDLLEALRETLAQVDLAGHVSPALLLDKELDWLSDDLCPGISEFRSELSEITEGRAIEKLPHEEIIRELDQAGQTFVVLLVKTPQVMPYTSVFIRLECGYWSPESEASLRKAMADGQAN